MSRRPSHRVSRADLTVTLFVVDPPPKALGVHLKAGVAWLAVVDADGDLVLDRVDRLEPPKGLSEARALAELEESLEHLLNRLHPGTVALLKPGSSTRNPSPSVSRSRGRLEGAVLIAAHRSGTPLVEVTHDAVERCVGARPPAAEFPDLALAHVTSGRPARWGERAPAFAAGLTALTRGER